MSKYIDADRLRAEIERLKETHERNLDKPMERGRIGYAHGCIDCCDRILSFIDSLQQEQRGSRDMAIDVTRNAVWTDDCCGKKDLDFDLITADTRYWPDNTAKCSLSFIDNIREPTGGYERILLIQSDYIKGESHEEVDSLVRKWYNDNAIPAMEKAIKLLNEGQR